MSCFLLFVTLISTFQDSQLGRKTPLWARVVDIIFLTHNTTRRMSGNRVFFPPQTYHRWYNFPRKRILSPSFTLD